MAMDCPAYGGRRANIQAHPQESDYCEHFAEATYTSVGDRRRIDAAGIEK